MASYAIKTPSFEVEEGGCRQRPPSILGFGGSCSSIVVLTTSLRERLQGQL